MLSLAIPYASLLALRRQLGTRMNLTEDAGAYYPRTVVDGKDLYAVVAKDGPDAAAFEADVLPYCNAPLNVTLGRVKTHDLAVPATWRDYTLPADHAHRAPAAFVTRAADGNTWEATGEWVAPAGADKRGRYKALDQVALPYDANDPETYWQPFPTFRITAPAGYQVVLARAWVTTNQFAALPDGASLDFQAWTYYDPIAGVPCAPGATFIHPEYGVQPCPLVAPPLGLWRYSSVDTLVDLADDVSHARVVVTGEDAAGPRTRLTFDYAEDLYDVEAREAALDGRFGQFFELTITNHEPITNAAHAVGAFKLVTRPMF